MVDVSQVREALRCCECGRLWLDDLERWRAYLTVDDDVAHYCPACAVAEFDG